MFKKELLIIATVLSAIFLAVAGAGWLAVWKLHETSRTVVVDTLPGLASAGLAQERMHDNRHTMHQMLSPHTAAERAQLIARVNSSRTDALWRDYAGSIFEPEDRSNYQAMMTVRSNYLAGTEQFMALVQVEKITEAQLFFDGDLSRRFQDYTAAAKILFDYNVREGSRRGQTIMTAFRYAPWLIGGLCLLVFVIGMVFGLRSACGNK
ncbi:MAG: MCP four helix bundle domain-containing protein [Verrucomicrobiota bacterium]